MTLHAWLPFALVALAVSLVPGPAVIAVVSTAVRRGVRASLLTNAGILIGDAVFVCGAAAGLGGLLLASHTLFTVVKWLGIAYLVYLGVRALVARGAAVSDVAPVHSGSTLRLGLATQLANPKVMMFFGALLPQFVDVRFAAAPQFALLGATFIASDALVFVAYALLADRARRVLAAPRYARTTSRVTGVAMLGAAARLAVER